MSNVTKPIILDETGQAIRAVIKESASIIADKIKGGGGKSSVVYGFHISSSEADPSAAVTYLKDAVGMTPARMDYLNNKFYYGSWADAFFMPRPCMVAYNGTVDYYLDPDDYEKKENGEVSALGDSTLGYGIKYQGNAMMEWGRNEQQIWTKVVPDANDPYSGSVYIANKQVDSNYVAWPFVNNQGVLKTHFYTPIYNGSLTAYKVSSTTYYRLRSIPRRPVMNSPGNNAYDIPWDDNTVDAPGNLGSTLTQASHEVELALNNNPNINYTLNTTYPDETYFTTNRSSIGWFTEVYADIQLINNLLILIGKSLNTQEIFGNGNMSGNSYSSIGYQNNGVLYTGSHEYTTSGPNYSVLNKTGLFWGSNGDRYAVKVFGMENWWGNQWRRYAGHIGDTSSNTSTYNHFIKNTFGKEDGSNCIGYSTVKTGYIDTLCETVQGSKYIRANKFINTVTYGGKTYTIANSLASNNSLPGTVGSGSYYCDYFYQSTGTHYAIRGGVSNIGYQCGAIAISFFNLSTIKNWWCGAALSFKPVS